MITAASVGAPQPGLDRESQALRLQADLLCTAVWQWSPTSSLVTGHLPPPGEQLAVLPPPCNTTPLGPHLRLAPGAHGGLAGLRRGVGDEPHHGVHARRARVRVQQRGLVRAVGRAAARARRRRERCAAELLRRAVLDLRRAPA
jgi:hypothetical protein